MTTLMLTRGLPGSGKTTWARGWVADAAPGARVRVNRDDLRMLMFGRYVLTGPEEDAVTVTQHAAVLATLKDGRDVVVDDTNLSARTVKQWYKIADKAMAWVAFHDLDVTVETAQAQNVMRDKAVDPAVIQRFADRYLKKGKLPAPPEMADAVSAAGQLYRPDKTKPRAWMFDVDGTLMHMKERGPFDWHRVLEDESDESVSRLARLIRSADMGDDNHPDMLIVMSGRDQVCQPDTLESLYRAGIEPDAIFMRPMGDMRKDSIVKLELFNKHVRPYYWVQGVIDDRQQVVDMWREIGLTCYQCYPGDF